MSAKKFSIICYNEEFLQNFLQTRASSIKEYAYILHDAEEEEKRKHIHVYVEFFNPVNHNTIAKQLGIDFRLVQTCRDKYKLIRYLVHKDDPQKIQYDLTDIITNIDYNIIYNVINQDNSFKSDEDFLALQLDYLHSGFTLNNLIQLSISNKNVTELRKYWNIIKYYYEHLSIFVDK